MSSLGANHIQIASQSKAMARNSADDGPAFLFHQLHGEQEQYEDHNRSHNRKLARPGVDAARFTRDIMFLARGAKTHNELSDRQDINICGTFVPRFGLGVIPINSTGKLLEDLLAGPEFEAPPGQERTNKEEADSNELRRIGEAQCLRSVSQPEPASRTTREQTKRDADHGVLYTDQHMLPN